jgi:hypothetical protein
MADFQDENQTRAFLITTQECQLLSRVKLSRYYQFIIDQFMLTCLQREGLLSKAGFISSVRN